MKTIDMQFKELTKELLMLHTNKMRSPCVFVNMVINQRLEKLQRLKRYCLFNKHNFCLVIITDRTGPINRSTLKFRAGRKHWTWSVCF